MPSGRGVIRAVRPSPHPCLAGDWNRQEQCCKNGVVPGWRRPPVDVRPGSMRIVQSTVIRSSLLFWAWVPRGDVPAEEVAHEPSDQVPIAFQREVPGVEQVELQSLEVALVRLRPGGREDLVVLAPGDQHRRLVLSEVLLPLRVERRVTA